MRNNINTAMKTRRFLLGACIAGVAAAASVSLSGCAGDGDRAASSGSRGAAVGTAAQLTAAEARAIAEEAYIYGYSLMTTHITRVQQSNVAKVEGLHAPLGTFINVEKYPPAEFRGISAPNADTLYSLAWVDLAEPMVLSHPEMGSRYFLLEIVDYWMTDHAESPSARMNKGGGAANYLFTGPGWRGQVPSGMRHIPMGTRYMCVLGRTYADGTEADYKAVNALQAQYRLTPLSQWGEGGAGGKSYAYAAPPVDPNPGFSMTDKPQTVLLGMSTEEYFNTMARLMGNNAPPMPADREILAKMATLGIVPGKPFDAKALSDEARSAIKDVPRTALAKIEAGRPTLGRNVNGWVITTGLGEYGTNYLKRAVVAAFGWPANREFDAVYPNATVDRDGRPLTGENKYTVTFPKGQTPPVNAFWSITMYGIDDGWWFVANPLNKFTVSMRDNPKFNDDGSLTLYFQHESPGKEKEANWLPAPKGPFVLMLRMYWPKNMAPSVLDGSWTVPGVVRVE